MDLRDLIGASKRAFTFQDELKNLFPSTIDRPYGSYERLMEDIKRVEPSIVETSKLLASVQHQQWYKDSAAQLVRFARLQTDILAREDVRSFGLGLSQTVRQMIGPYSTLLETSQRFAETITKLSSDLKGPIVRMQEILASAIPETHLIGLQKLLTNYSDNFWIQWDDTQRRAFKLFAKLALVGLEGHLAQGELLTVLRIHRKKGRDGVLKYIFSRFRRNKYRLLNEMTRRWWRVPYLAKRKKAIRAALKAHKDGIFELTIPTLLPFVDGLAAEIVPKLPQKAGVIRVKDAAKMYHDRFSEWASECVLTVVDTVIYKRVDFDKPKRRSSINRHAILHGRVVEYASELNSYRVILLLDMMFNIYEATP